MPANRANPNDRPGPLSVEQAFLFSRLLDGDVSAADRAEADALLAANADAAAEFAALQKLDAALKALGPVPAHDAAALHRAVLERIAGEAAWSISLDFADPPRTALPAMPTPAHDGSALVRRIRSQLASHDDRVGYLAAGEAGRYLDADEGNAAAHRLATDAAARAAFAVEQKLQKLLDRWAAAAARVEARVDVTPNVMAATAEGGDAQLDAGLAEWNRRSNDAVAGIDMGSLAASIRAKVEAEATPTANANDAPPAEPGEPRRLRFPAAGWIGSALAAAAAIALVVIVASPDDATAPGPSPLVQIEIDDGPAGLPAGVREAGEIALAFAEPPTRENADIALSFHAAPAAAAPADNDDGIALTFAPLPVESRQPDEGLFALDDAAARPNGSVSISDPDSVGPAVSLFF